MWCLLFVICHFPFFACRLSFVMCPSSSVICCLSYASVHIKKFLQQVKRTFVNLLIVSKTISIWSIKMNPWIKILYSFLFCWIYSFTRWIAPITWEQNDSNYDRLKTQLTTNPICHGQSSEFYSIIYLCVIVKIIGKIWRNVINYLWSPSDGMKCYEGDYII